VPEERSDSEELVLRAFAFTRPLVPIVPAPRRRQWMDDAKDRWPNRCLPLLVANEAGWVLLNPCRFEAVWDGNEPPSGLTITFDGEPPDPAPVASHFGFGVVTWAIPYVFRTTPGFNLLARGPANLPKDGVWPLEGLVETDWSFANFTMNWKLTRPGHTVVFEKDEPFCMLVPQRRGELEAFRTEMTEIQSDPEVQREFELFGRNRSSFQAKKFLAGYAGEFADYKTDWERQYYKGLTPSGGAAPEHQMKLRLTEFVWPDEKSSLKP
jgi:hypothetical protein